MDNAPKRGSTPFPEKEPIVNAGDSDVTNTEQELLKKAAGHPANEETADRARLALDDTDEDGDPLEEGSSPLADPGGEDLDIPGAELDDEDEMLGEEDEENNSYSLPD